MRESVVSRCRPRLAMNGKAFLCLTSSVVVQSFARVWFIRFILPQDYPTFSSGRILSYFILLFLPHPFCCRANFCTGFSFSLSIAGSIIFSPRSKNPVPHFCGTGRKTPAKRGQNHLFFLPIQLRITTVTTDSTIT